MYSLIQSDFIQSVFLFLSLKSLKNLLNFFVCLFLLGLMICGSGDRELRVKLLRLKLETLVRSGGEKAADQALETFSQVM